MSLPAEILSQKIKLKALEIGFDLVGIADACLPEAHLSFFKAWLLNGKQASMEWMQRGMEKRLDPQKKFPGVKSVICVGLSYYRGHPLSIKCHQDDSGWISNYAWGEDYHHVLLEKLKRLENFILDITGGAPNHNTTVQKTPPLQSYVDTGPILERSYAAVSGLGWIGKNTCLINRHRGSFVFLGEMLTTLDLVPDLPAIDHCGKCTRCLDACPTRALKPYALDANRCISYLTIEHRGPISSAFQKEMGTALVGCDICQDVCPWNQGIPVSKENSFDPRPGNFAPPFAELEGLSTQDFNERFKGSSIRRVTWEGLKRNLEIAESNEFLQHRR